MKSPTIRHFCENSWVTLGALSGKTPIFNTPDFHPNEILTQTPYFGLAVRQQAPSRLASQDAERANIPQPRNSLHALFVFVFFCFALVSPSWAGTFQGLYYQSLNPTGTVMKTTYTEHISEDWGNDGPQSDSLKPNYMNPTNFSVEWTGWIDCPISGNYHFETLSDDGVRLFLDDSGQPVIDAWYNREATDPANTGDIYLVAGAHKLRFDYYQGPGPNASVQLFWRKANAAPGSTVELVTAADTPTKIWTVGSAISGSGWVMPSGAGVTTGTRNNPIYLDEKQVLHLEAVQSLDTDNWTQGAVMSGSEPGTMGYSTSVTANGSAGSVVPNNSRIADYTAPTLDEMQTGRDVHMLMYVQDTDTIGAGESGQRNDSPDVVNQFEIRVRQKVWSTDSPLGYAPDQYGSTAPGSAIPDGRLIAPVDTRTNAPRAVYAAPGGVVTCQMEDTTDSDYLVYEPNSQKVVRKLDDASYVWTASAGKFRVSNGDGTYSYPTQVTGKIAYFVAPDASNGQSATATVTCTVSDNEQKGPDDSGSRKDDNLVRTQDIIVPANTASLDLYRASSDATDTTAQGYTRISGNIGGQVFAGLTINNGAGMRAQGSTVTVRLEEQASNGISHPANQNHIDIRVPLNTKTGWLKNYDPDGTSGPKQTGWWPAPEAPNTRNGMTGIASYRYLIPWNTQAQTNSAILVNNAPESFLWGHNGPHRFSLISIDGTATTSFSFTSNYGGTYLDSVGASTATVKNTTITGVSTNNGTTDYFKFSAESDDTTLSQPTISFTIADAGDTHSYNWKVRIRGTDQDEDPYGVLISGTASSPGLITAKVNDPTASGQMQEGYDTDHPNGNGIYTTISEYGTYTFDISVQEVDDWGSNVDNVQSYRSTKAYFPYYFTNASGQTVRGHSGDMVMGTDGIERYYVNYYISDTSAPANSSATSLLIQTLPPDLGIPVASSDSSWSKALNTPVENKLLMTFTTPRQPGTYITPFTAVDNHASEYRDHANKPLLAKNDRKNNTPTLINDTRNGDRVVSAQITGANGVVYGKKVLHIQIWPAGSTVWLHVVPPQSGSGGAKILSPQDGKPYAWVSLKGAVDAQNKPVTQSITITGEGASSSARNLKLTMAATNGGTPIPFTYGQAQVTSWEFTCFKLNPEVIISGDVDKIIPKGVENSDHKSLVQVWTDVQPIPSTLKSNSLGNKSFTSSPTNDYYSYGGVVIRASLYPIDLDTRDINNMLSRSSGFMLYQYLNARYYKGDGSYAVDFSDQGTYKSLSNFEDVAKPGDKDFVFNKDILGDDKKYIWFIDLPSCNQDTFVNNQALNVGDTLRRRLNFRDFFSYADVQCSTEINWNWRSSAHVILTKYNGQDALAIEQVDDILDDNQMKIDNKLTTGATTLTPNLKPSSTNFSVSSRTVSGQNGIPICMSGNQYNGGFFGNGLNLPASSTSAYGYFIDRSEKGGTNHLMTFLITNFGSSKIDLQVPCIESIGGVFFPAFPGRYIMQLDSMEDSAKPPHNLEYTQPPIYKDEVIVNK